MAGLKATLGELKFALKFPKLHLTQHFEEVINRVDIAAEKEIKHSPKNVIDLINDQRKEMIDKLKDALNQSLSSCSLHSKLIEELELSLN